ncbi:hypothetical protein GSI_03169 [Ganoderma sinense ZZ0214-1]|uniref:Uncharacterized protein n=1 Tax=Ganoderma sinense ZZ0214-1 TaxID=1077348 RepID=A0A2G8SKV5_9APHY|nr:hypothetical protein GSI_03169 [Ganoderma sinense ZZ0214-1]
MGLLSIATIFSTFVQAMLYGFAVLMFILTMWILLGTHRRRKPNVVMVASSCTVMLLATAEMGLNVARIYEGFVSTGPLLPGGPEQYFDSVSIPTFVIKSCLFNAQSLILDAIVIYRAYIVWQNFFVIVFPSILWGGLLAASIGTNLVLTGKKPPELFGVGTNPWITTVYALDVATNLSATGILALKLWSVIRSTSSYRSSDGLAPVLRVAIESGLIYTMTMSAGLILFLLRSRLVYVIMDISSPIVFIVMNMIVVRVGLAKERKKRCGSGHSRSFSRPALADIETMGFVAVPRPISIPRPSYIRDRERPESEAALRYSLRAERDEVEVSSVAFKLARLALQDDDPLTPDDHDRRYSARDSGVGFVLGMGMGMEGEEEDDELEVKSASDLALDSARASTFHIISERDIT